MDSKFTNKNTRKSIKNIELGSNYIVFTCLAASLLCSSILLPPLVLVLIGLAVGIFSIAKGYLTSVICSLALFGLSFLEVTANILGVQASLLVLLLDFACIIYIIKIYRKLKFYGYGKIYSVTIFWWIIVVTLYAVFVLVGPDPTYGIQVLFYFLIYGTFYFLSATIVSIQGCSVRHCFALGVLWFSFIYPSIEIPIFEVRVASSGLWGLRGVPGFNPIEAPRTSGLLIIGVIVSLQARRISEQIMSFEWIPLVVAFPIFWYSYTRQAYVAVFVTLILYLVVTLLHKRASNSPSKSNTIIAATVFIGIIAMFAFQLFIENTDSRISVDTFSGQTRFAPWLASIELISENPIFGIGIGGFSSQGNGVWPHNWFLEAWLELSILGLFIFLYFGYKLILATVTRVQSKYYVFALLGFYYLVLAQFSADIARNAIMFYFIVVAFYETGKVNSSSKISRKRASNEFR